MKVINAAPSQKLQSKRETAGAVHGDPNAWREAFAANGSGPLTLESHRYAELFPPMTVDELRELGLDIRRRGLQLPIVTYQGKILDGRHRYQVLPDPPSVAQILAGADRRFQPFKGSDEQALEFVLAANLHRRHLTESQRAMTAVRLSELRAVGRPKKRVSTDTISAPPRPSLAQAAKALQVSTPSAKRARKVIDKGIAEVAAAVDAGKLSVTRGQQIASLPAKEQKASLAAHLAPKKEPAAREKPSPPGILASWVPKRLTLDFDAADRASLQTIGAEYRLQTASAVVKKILRSEAARIIAEGPATKQAKQKARN